jgi:hypothetical protein
MLAAVTAWPILCVQQAGQMAGALLAGSTIVNSDCAVLQACLQGLQVTVCEQLPQVAAAMKPARSPHLSDSPS